MEEIIFLDYLAFAVLILCWLGYSLYSHQHIKKTDNIMNIIYDFRLKWMTNCALRKDRGEDVLAIGQLMRSITFCASTTILVIAFLAPLYNYVDQAQSVFGKVPFLYISASPVWELKVTIIEILFIYSFFKCTWSLRQYNYSLIMMLAMPLHKKIDADAKEDIARNAQMLTNAARHFTLSIRGFYFGLISLGWLFHPILFIALNFLVIWIIYRREFRSKAFDIVNSNS